MEYNKKLTEAGRKEFFIRLNRLMWRLDRNNYKNGFIKRGSDRV